MAETASPSTRGQLAVVGIFALGVVFGLALSFVLVHHVIPPERMGGMPREGPVPIDRMTGELDLDPAQQEKIRAILERGHATMRGVLDDTSREIRAVLRPDQQEKFDRMRPRSPFGHGVPHDGPHGNRHGGEPPEPPPEPPH
jgi:Spy/CpxP family protein refolding chaperone